MQGELKNTDLVEVIGSLYRNRLTGVLTLQNERGEASVYLEKGRLIFSRSSRPDDRLGPYLLIQEKIRYDQYLDAARRFQNEEKRFGTILVESGYLSPDDLYEGVVGQVKRIITHLFHWEDGKFDFQEGPLPSPEVITLNIDTPTLLIDGIKQIDHWSRIEYGVGSPETLYRLQADHEKIIELLALSPQEYALLVFVKENCSLRDILHVSELGDIETCRLIWAFRALGVMIARIKAGENDTAQMPEEEVIADADQFPRKLSTI